jgi:septum formation protein
MKLILASQSPRRQELLTNLGLSFDVHPADIVEEYKTNDPQEFVHVLALEKAQKIHQLTPECMVLAADTTVFCQNQILEKPQNYQDALRMLNLLSGCTHQVFTAVAICLPDQLNRPKPNLASSSKPLELSLICKTSVTFRKLHLHEIEFYLKNYQYLDKAGAYGIQSYAASFIDSIMGSYSNVMGLPLCQVVQKFAEISWHYGETQDWRSFFGQTSIKTS